MMKEYIYSVAVYLRLSRDDEDIDGSTKAESNKIVVYDERNIEVKWNFQQALSGALFQYQLALV